MGRKGREGGKGRVVPLSEILNMPLSTMKLTSAMPTNHHARHARMPLDTGRDYGYAGVPFANIYLIHLRVAVLTFAILVCRHSDLALSRHFALSPF